MAGLVPAIHALLGATLKIVDARHKAGHDEVIHKYEMTCAFCNLTRR
jgi:hypothetical protein